MRQLSAPRGWLASGLAIALALVVCGGAFDWGHMDGDDPDCSVTLVQFDNAAHPSLGVPAGRSQPTGHCYICHALRLLRTALRVHAGLAVLDLRATQWSCPADRAVVRSAPGLALSSRAPPAVHL